MLAFAWIRRAEYVTLPNDWFAVCDCEIEPGSVPFEKR